MSKAHGDWLAGVITELVDPRTTEDRFEEIVRGMDGPDRETALRTVSHILSGSTEDHAERLGEDIDDYMDRFRSVLRQHLIETEEATP